MDSKPVAKQGSYFDSDDSEEEEELNNGKHDTKAIPSLITSCPDPVPTEIELEKKGENVSLIEFNKESIIQQVIAPVQSQQQYNGLDIANLNKIISELDESDDDDDDDNHQEMVELTRKFFPTKQSHQLSQQHQPQQSLPSSQVEKSEKVFESPSSVKNVVSHSTPKSSAVSFTPTKKSEETQPNEFGSQGNSQNNSSKIHSSSNPRKDFQQQQSQFGGFTVGFIKPNSLNPSSSQIHEEPSFGFQTPKTTTTTTTGQNQIDAKKAIVNDLKSFGFQISASAQNNPTFSKFCDLFEQMEDEENEEQLANDKVNVDSQSSRKSFQEDNNEQSISFTKNSDKSTKIASSRDSSCILNSKEDGGFSTCSGSKVSSTPTGGGMFSKASNSSGIIEGSSKQKKSMNTTGQSGKSNVIEELREFTGFKVSASTQNNKQFSKFCDLFETMDDEEVGLNDAAQDKMEVEIEQHANPFKSASGGLFSVASAAAGSGTSKRALQDVPNKKEQQAKESQENESDQTHELDEYVRNFMQPSTESSDTFFGFQTANNSKQLAIDPKKLSVLYTSFLGADSKKGISQDGDGMDEDAADATGQLEDDEKKYDAFFSKSSNGNGEGGGEFVGFMSARGDTKLQIDPVKLKQLEKIYDSQNDQQTASTPGRMGNSNRNGGDDDLINAKEIPGSGSGQTKTTNSKFSNSFSKKSSGLAVKRKEPVSHATEEEGKDASVSSFSSGFTNGFASKKLKYPSEQKKDVSNYDFEEEKQTIGSESNSKKNSVTFKEKLNSHFKSLSTPKKNTEENPEEEEDDEKDPFSMMLKMVSKKPVEQPVKRDHPKPFKPVKVTDSSKSTPSASLKVTPQMKSSLLSTPTSSGVKSTKLDGKSFSYKAKFQLSEDAASSYNFTKDSGEKQPSFEKSGKSSLQKPFMRPSIQMASVFENSNSQLNGDERLDLASKSRKSRISMNGSQTLKKNLFSQIGQEFDADSSKPIPIPKLIIPLDFARNPFIQMKFGYDPLILSFKIVKFEELSRSKQSQSSSSSKTIRSPNSQQLLSTPNTQESTTIEIEESSSSLKLQSINPFEEQQSPLTPALLRTLSKDINQCLQIVLPCPCKQHNQPLVFSENIFTKRMECFCSLSKGKSKTSTSTSSESEEQTICQVTVKSFYEKLHSKHKATNEQWVRTHFRQIVWKLACYESNLQDVPINKRATVSNIYNELEARMFSEVFGCRRSVLKQIAEQDASKSVTMVLVVANIVYNEQFGLFLIELSDGWYSVFVVVFDQKFQNTTNATDMYYSSNKLLLLDLVRTRKLCTGKKIYVTSLTAPPVQNLEKFIAPNQNLMYQKVQEIYYNNIISAPPTAKLGICNNPMQKYFPRSLKSLRPFGGAEIPSIDVFIAKKYPLCYESGLVKKSLCLKKSIEDQGMDATKTIGFTVVVVDALSYYDPSFRFEQQPWTEVNIHTVSNELYDSLKEGTRIRLFNLKINMKSQPNSKFDFRMLRTIKNVLILDTSKKTKIEEMSTFIRSRDEQIKQKQFGSDIVETYKLLLEDVQENIKANGYDKEILEQKLLANRVEVDVIMHVVRVENGTYFGINSNYSAICITPTKEISGHDGSGNKSSGGFGAWNSGGGSGDSEGMSKEDEALYEKLMKNREQSSRASSSSSNYPPMMGFAAATSVNSIVASDRVVQPAHPDEGKVCVFLNAQIENIKQTSLSTTHVDMYHFNYTLNTHKRIIAADGNSSAAFVSAYSQVYRTRIQELQECVRLNSEKFAQVSTYLQNC